MDYEGESGPATFAIDTACITFRNPATNSPIKCGCGALDKLKELNMVNLSTTRARRITPFYKRARTPPPSSPRSLKKTVHCKFYLRNACTKVECKYLHDAQKLREVIALQQKKRAEEMKKKFCWVRPGYTAQAEPVASTSTAGQAQRGAQAAGPQAGKPIKLETFEEAVPELPPYWGDLVD